MRFRSLGAVVCLVVFVHAAVLLGPWQWHQTLPDMAPPASAAVQAFWVERVVPPALAPAPIALAPQPRPQRPAKRQRVPAAPGVAIAAAPAPAIAMAQEAFTPFPEEAVRNAVAPQPPLLLPAADAAAMPALVDGGPQLQVQGADGTHLQPVLPDDGQALSQHMLLRFKVHGFVKQQEYHAHAELEWQVDGSQYQARQSISAFLLGSLEQRSTGRLSDQGLQPVDFIDRRFFKTRSVHFDWAGNQALFTPERPAARIGRGAQDRLSVFMQLAAMLQAMPLLRQSGVRIEIPVLGSRSLQMWTFVVEGEELLELPDGAMQTLRLHRQPRAGEAETAQLWVDPSRGFVPVRIHMQEGNGDEMDLSLKR